MPVRSITRLGVVVPLLLAAVAVAEEEAPRENPFERTEAMLARTGTPPERHLARVDALGFIDSKKLALSLDAGGVLCAWSLRDGSLVAQKRLTHRVRLAAFSPDGSWLFYTEGKPETIDPKTVHDRPAEWMGLWQFPSEKWFVVDADVTSRRWKPEPVTQSSAPSKVIDFAWSATGKRFAVLDYWGTRVGKPGEKMGRHGVTLHPLASAVACTDRQVYVAADTKLSTDSYYETVTVLNPIRAIAADPKRKRVAAVGEIPVITLWEESRKHGEPFVSRGQLLSKLDRVSKLLFTPDGRGLIVAYGGRNEIWNMQKESLACQFDGPSVALAFSSRLKRLARSGLRGKLEIVELTSAFEKPEVEFELGAGAAESPTPRILGTSSIGRAQADGSYLIHDPKGAEILRLPAVEGKRLAVVPADATAATGLQIVQRESGIVALRYPGGDTAWSLDGVLARDAEASRNGKALALLGKDVVLLDPQNGKERKRIDSRGDGLTFSADGSVVGMLELHEAVAYDTRTGLRRAARQTPGGPTGVGFRSDGSAVLIGRRDGYVQPTADGEPLGPEALSAVEALAAHGTRTAVGYACGLVVVWNGKARRTYVGHVGPVRDMAFLEDGKQLLTTSVDGQAILWDLAR